MEWSVEVSI